MLLDVFNLFNFKTNIKIQEELINEGFDITHNSCDIINSSMVFQTTYKNIAFSVLIERDKKNNPTLFYVINSNDKFYLKEKNGSFNINLELIKAEIEALADKILKINEAKQKVEADKRAVIFKLDMIQAFIEAELQKHFNNWTFYKAADGSMIITFNINLVKNDYFVISMSPPRSREDFLEKDIETLNFKIDYKSWSKKYNYSELCFVLDKIHNQFDLLKTERERIVELANEIKAEEERLAKNKKEVRTLEIKVCEEFEKSITDILRQKINQEELLKAKEIDDEGWEESDYDFFAMLIR